MTSWKFEAIGVVESPFKEKFGIPRQPGVVPEARAKVRLRSEFSDALEGLEEFSHIWLVFVFHQLGETWKPKVRPPRLGGKEKVGVFASRSPHRPNPIGISAVELVRVSAADCELEIRGCDLLDGTPIVDIKPYIGYADSIPQASPGWTGRVDERKLEVSFAPGVFDELGPGEDRDSLRALVQSILEADPRPAFQTGQASYAFRLLSYDVHWSTDGTVARVERLIRVQEAVSQ